MKKGKAAVQKEGDSDWTTKGVAIITGAENQQIETVRAFARDIINATGELAGKYLALCLYIRAEKVSPKIVAAELLGAGFKKSRVSEINRVANTSAELFSTYEAKQIGFDKTLALARAEGPSKKAVLTPAANQLVGAKLFTTEELAQAEVVPEQGAKAKVKPPGQRMKAHAKAICLLAEREVTFRFTNLPFMVKVEKLSIATFRDKVGKTLADGRKV